MHSRKTRVWGSSKGLRKFHRQKSAGNADMGTPKYRFLPNELRDKFIALLFFCKGICEPLSGMAFLSLLFCVLLFWWGQEFHMFFLRRTPYPSLDQKSCRTKIPEFSKIRSEFSAGRFSEFPDKFVLRFPDQISLLFLNAKVIPGKIIEIYQKSFRESRVTFFSKRSLSVQRFPRVLDCSAFSSLLLQGSWRMGAKFLACCWCSSLL